MYQIPAKVLSASPQEREPPVKMMKHEHVAENLNNEGNLNFGYLSQSHQSVDYFGELEDNSFVDLLGPEENSIDIITTVYRDDDDGAFNTQRRSAVMSSTDRESFPNNSHDNLAKITGNQSFSSSQINEQSRHLDSGQQTSDDRDTILRNNQRELDRQQRQSLQKAVNFEVYGAIGESDDD
jgi:hypothetical protein